MGKCFWHCSDPKNVSIFHYMVVHVLDIAQAWLTHAIDTVVHPVLNACQ